MTSVFNSFESPASGTTLTTGNTSNADGSAAFNTITIGTGGTLQADSLRAAHGSQSLKVASGATAAQTYALWTSATAPFSTANGQIWGRVYCYFTANPSGTFRVVQVLDSGSTFVGAVAINSSGKVVANFGANSVATTSTAAIPLNAWFRLEFMVLASATVGQTEVKIFTTSPDATSPDETNTSTANLNTIGTTCQGARVGLAQSTANLGPVWLDEVAFSNVGYIGPLVTAFSGSGAVTETAAIAGSGGTSGSGAVAETATIAGAGSANYTKTGSQTVTAAIAGAGGGSGAGSVAAVASIAGAGTATGTGAVTVTAAIAGAGSLPGAFTGTGAVTVTASVAGAGGTRGTGSVAPVAAVAGAGSVGYVGSGTVSVTASIAGSGSGSGAGSVAATAAIAGAGSVGLGYVFNDAEDGTNGSAVVAGTGTSADGSTKFGTVTGTGTLIYDNTHPLDGALAFKMTTDGSGAGREGVWDSTQFSMGPQQYVSELLYLTALPASSLVVGQLNTGAGGTKLRVRINSTGNVVLTDTSGATIATTTSTVPTGAWFRLEYALLASSATVGQAEVRLFTSPYGTTPTETQTSAATANTTATAIGQILSPLGGPASYSYWFDQIRTSTTGYPPAPTSPAYTGSGSRTVTATIAGSGALGYTGTGSVTATATIAGTGFAPGSGTGSLSVSATITGTGIVSDSGALTAAATISGAGKTTSLGAVNAVASITGTGALAVNYTPRTATSGSGNSRIITTTLPTGTTAGDLLLCHLSISQGGTAFTQPTVTTPTGWTLVPGSTNPLVSQGTNAGIVGAWYYRWATGTDPAPGWTLNASTIFKYSWIVEGYSGGTGSGAPRLIAGTGTTGGTPADTNTTGTTTISPASWYAETFTERSTTNTSYTTPAGTTRRTAVFGSGGGAVDMLYVDSGLSVAGPVGGDTTTDDGSGAAWQLHGLIVFPALTSAGLTVTATITGSGTVVNPNSSSLTVTASISGTGTVSGFNPGLFVPASFQQITYTLQLVDAPHLGTSSAVVGDLAQASGKQLTLSTPDGSQLVWTMPGLHDESSLVGGAGVPGGWEMSTDAIFWRDAGQGPVKLWRGRVMGGNDTSDGNTYTIPWTAVDYKALFASKLLLDGDTLTFSAATDVAAIAWALISTCQGRTNGNMGLTKSSDGWNGGGTANTGKTFGASFVVTPGTDLQSALNTLLAGDTSTPSGAAAGFDWWIDPDLKVHIKSRDQVSPNPPGRGTASTFVADYQGTVRAFTRTPLVDQYANVVRGDGGTVPSTATAPTVATDPMGRVERAVTVTVDSTQTTAQQNALVAQVTAEALYVGNLPASSFSLTLTTGSWDPSILGVGDNVQVQNLPGRLAAYDGLQRTLTLQIDVSDDGDEQVTVTTQRPDVTHWQADALVKLGDRVRGLELRA